MLRLAFTVTLIILAGPLAAQTFRGKVLDLITKTAISGATVKGRTSTFTDGAGNFSLGNVKIGDTIRIIHIGYKSYAFTFNASHPGLAQGTPPEISLEPVSIQLQQVVVRSSRNYKADSLKNRKEFAQEFGYKAPVLKDIFVVRSPEEAMARHIDVHKGNNPYSASSLVKIDVLQAAGLLSKNKTARSKLQRTMMQDEADRYLNQLFSEERIASLTKLKGDSLKNFMNRYRPPIAIARSMTDYEMIAYIRSKYSDFVK